MLPVSGTAGAGGMAFEINRLRAVTPGDPGFAGLMAALPDGADNCICCGRPARDSVAVVLVADESDDNPLALCSAICSTCSAAQPIDQLLADWAEGLADR
jgi:hypothetical protein